MNTKPFCVRTLLSMERNASLEAGTLGELVLQVLSGLKCKQRTRHIKRQTLQDIESDKIIFFTIFVLRISRHESLDSNKSPFPSGLLKSPGLRNLKDIESVSRFQVRQTFVKLLATLRELLRWQGAS